MIGYFWIVVIVFVFGGEVCFCTSVCNWKSFLGSGPQNISLWTVAYGIRAKRVYGNTEYRITLPNPNIGHVRVKTVCTMAYGFREGVLSVNAEQRINVVKPTLVA